MSPASIYLSTLIARSSKSIVTIAEELGYPHANIISMFKTGHTKIPLNVVGPLATALDGDPVHLFKLALQEQYPDTHRQILAILGQTGGLTQGERSLVALYRDAMSGQEIDLEEVEMRDRFCKHFDEVAERQAVWEQASRERYERLPRNGKHRT